ncbi:hypothetical protein EMIHUDRAFT_254077 [Emiliania huxleyi CCMP1516]|uniref:NHL repeat containing protein n=2 Tax=Emiliania huxleyi TaxID=2903 RepID=A0A0D3JYU9_EMIH1|nr:hypothetical protein EMIHUDRAFT_254077 [Emiliania huxleyi CCMP1516]EOD28684.1 hypothetical protein EMIHUDRAFT_254077 [Emiliania huxleyi CCMP1516]|eukprot:XP_005781113.1 hypothetical protein EMIHUDRAFT_254077 [Emiliania huxleyi CCMP1516]
MSHFGSLAFAAATAIAAWQSPRVHRAPNPHAELVVVLEQPRHLGGFLGNSGSVAPLPGGRFCVSDTSSGRVLLIGSDGTRLASSPAMFEAPAALALSPSCDSVYLADATGHALHRLSLPDLSPICSTRPVEGARGLCYPAGLAVSPRDGRVFVSDKGNHRVVCYDAALSVELFSHGRCGGGEGELNSPSGLALLGGGGAEEERLVVADTDNHRLVLLGSEGGFVRSIGGRSDAPPPGLSEPEFLEWLPVLAVRPFNPLAGQCCSLSERASGVWHLLSPDGGRVRSGFRPHQRLLEEGVGREACEGGEGGQEEDGAGSWACGLAGGSRAGDAGRVFLVEDCGARVRIARTVRLV